MRRSVTRSTFQCSCLLIMKVKPSAASKREMKRNTAAMMMRQVVTPGIACLLWRLKLLPFRNHRKAVDNWISYSCLRSSFFILWLNGDERRLLVGGSMILWVKPSAASKREMKRNTAAMMMRQVSTVSTSPTSESIAGTSLSSTGERFSRHQQLVTPLDSPLVWMISHVTGSVSKRWNRISHPWTGFPSIRWADMEVPLESFHRSS